MQKIAIVILNWNGQKFLERFLPSLMAHTPSWADIVVADNASSDNSLEFMQLHYPQLRLIVNEGNFGFAKGYNQALQQIDAEYYCLLNSDIEVSPQWVEPIINFLDANSDVAICQPKLLSFYEKTHFEYAGAAGGFVDKYGYPFCRGRLFDHVEKDEGKYNDIKEIFWATGACMFIRSKVYHELGGLDDDFFAHMEEIDLCWRAKNAGYKVVYIPDSAVYHVGGGTLPKNSPRKTYLNFRNNLILLYKNIPKHRILWVFALRSFLDFIASVRFLFDSGWGDFAAVFKAYGSFYGSLRKNRKKRSKMPHRKVSQTYDKSIVFDYYFRKKKVFSDLNSDNFSK
jgi:GT2 family glycosyltransferase